MPPRPRPATTGEKKKRKAGNMCLGGFCKCGRSAAGAFRLPAKWAKREKILRGCLGPKPWPKELCVERLAGEYRVAHAHFLEADMTISTKGGKVVRRISGNHAAPKVAVKDMPAAPTAARPAPPPATAAPGVAAAPAAPATGGATTRPARGERAAQEAAQTIEALWQSAFDALEASEAEGSIPDGTTAMLKQQVAALNASDRANALLIHQLQEKVRLHELAAVQREGLEAEVREARSMAAGLKAQVKQLKKRVAKSQAFGYERLQTDKWLQEGMADFIYFENMEVLDCWIDFLDAAYPLDKLVWADGRGAHDGTDDGAGGEPKRRRRKFPLSPQDAIVCWLFIIKTGTNWKRTAKLFHTSRDTVRRAFITMLSLHKVIFQEEFFMLNEKALRAIIPAMMKTYKEQQGVDTNVGHIIDGFEVNMQKPSDDEAQASMWSNYKHNYTVKFLLGILSSGAMYFTSEGHGGSITDPVLTEICGFLDLMIKGIDVMADKGFLLQEQLESRGCLNWIPPVRRRGQEQLTAEENEETYNVANRRIYVEHGVRRIKEFGYFQTTLSIQQKHLHGDVAYCVAMLCNFANSLVPQEL